MSLSKFSSCVLVAFLMVSFFAGTAFSDAANAKPMEFELSRHKAPPAAYQEVYQTSTVAIWNPNPIVFGVPNLGLELVNIGHSFPTGFNSVRIRENKELKFYKLAVKGQLYLCPKDYADKKNFITQDCLANGPGYYDAVVLTDLDGDKYTVTLSNYSTGKTTNLLLNNQEIGSGKFLLSDIYNDVKSGCINIQDKGKRVCVLLYGDEQNDVSIDLADLWVTTGKISAQAAISSSIPNSETLYAFRYNGEQPTKIGSTSYKFPGLDSSGVRTSSEIVSDKITVNAPGTFGRSEGILIYGETTLPGETKPYYFDFAKAIVLDDQYNAQAYVKTYDDSTGLLGKWLPSSWPKVKVTNAVNATKHDFGPLASVSEQEDADGKRGVLFHDYAATKQGAALYSQAEASFRNVLLKAKQRGGLTQPAGPQQTTQCTTISECLATIDKKLIDSFFKDIRPTTSLSPTQSSVQGQQPPGQATAQTGAAQIPSAPSTSGQQQGAGGTQAGQVTPVMPSRSGILNKQGGTPGQGAQVQPQVAPPPSHPPGQPGAGSVGLGGANLDSAKLASEIFRKINERRALNNLSPLKRTLDSRAHALAVGEAGKNSTLASGPFLGYGLESDFGYVTEINPGSNESFFAQNFAQGYFESEASEFRDDGKMFENANLKSIGIGAATNTDGTSLYVMFSLGPMISSPKPSGQQQTSSATGQGAPQSIQGREVRKPFFRGGLSQSLDTKPPWLIWPIELGSSGVVLNPGDSLLFYGTTEINGKETEFDFVRLDVAKDHFVRAMIKEYPLSARTEGRWEVYNSLAGNNPVQNGNWTPGEITYGPVLSKSNPSGQGIDFHDYRFTPAGYAAYDRVEKQFRERMGPATPAAQGGQDFISTDDGPAAAPSLTAWLLSTDDDQAGGFNIFTSGSGSAERDTTDNKDFGWVAELKLSVPKNIKSMGVRKGTKYRYSTKDPAAYPLVIFRDGTKVNTSYADSLDLSLRSGTNLLNLYGQMSYGFSNYPLIPTNLILVVELDDGSKLEAQIKDLPQSTATAKSQTTAPESNIKVPSATATGGVSNMTINLLTISENKVGQFVFSPGYSGYQPDYKWYAIFELPGPKTLMSIDVYSPATKGWSTSDSASAFPLVVYHKDKKNSEARASLNWELPAGSNLLTFYGQPASDPFVLDSSDGKYKAKFEGATAVIKFTDGTSVTQEIPAKTIVR